MSEQQLNAFLEKVKGDTSLQEKLNGAADADAVVEIAKEAGFAITAEDMQSATIELSDEELEEAAGGRQCANNSMCYTHDGATLGNVRCNHRR